MTTQTAGAAIPITQPVAIQNLEIVSLLGYLDAWLASLQFTGSAARNETQAADLVRWLAIHDHIKKHLAAMQTPELDLPHYAPNPTPLDPAPPLSVVQNMDINTLTRALVAWRHEACHSDSAKRSTSFAPYDAARMIALAEHVDSLLAHIDDAPSLDLPNAPAVPMPAGPVVPS